MNVKRPDRIVQSPEGSLFISWVKGRQLIELEIEADGSVAWYFPNGMDMKDISEEVEGK